MTPLNTDLVRFPRESTYNATIRTGHFEKVPAKGYRGVEFIWKQDK